MTSPKDHLLVRTARGEAVERPPVWAMRQAGRWDPEFRKVRDGMGFYQFSEDVEKATLGTLCPKRLGVDGIILFYDITTLPIAMGLPFTLQPAIGPVPVPPVTTLADVERLNPHPDPSTYTHIRQLLKRVKEELRGELPVIVFAGAPFTVATYCIGTGKDMDATRRFAAEKPAVWDGLLERLSTATVDFLRILISEGADLYQVFDSWAGMLTPEEYDAWAQPYHEYIFAEATGVPRVIFVKECPYLEKMTQTGAEVISLGTRHDLAAALRDYPKLVFQGNVDEEILRKGTPEQVQEAVQKCLAASGGQRHIVNLNHGVDQTTPPENVETMIATVKGSAGTFSIRF